MLWAASTDRVGALVLCRFAPTSAELLRREFLEDLRNVHRRDRPELVHVDAVIMMRDQVAKVDDVSPRHGGMPGTVLRCLNDVGHAQFIAATQMGTASLRM